MSLNDVSAMLDAAVKGRGGARAVVDRATRGAQARAELELDDDDSSPTAPAGSEDALALQMVDLHGDDIKITPGLGWMIATPDKWVRDDSMRVYDLARQVARRAGNSAEKTAERRALASAKTVNSIVSLARTDARVVLPASAWDRDPWALNTPSGIVDLRTGQRTDRGATDFVTQCSRVTPCSASDCPTWLRFLSEVFIGDAEQIEFIQRLIGYTLTADRREQKLFFMYGLGSNGKSTLWDFVLWMVGTYALKLPSQVLMDAKTQGHPTELAQLRGRRLAISSELEEGQYWAEARIKELTGDEVLTARFMRQDFFEFGMTQKHVIVGNYKPRLKGGDAALARRFVLVPFMAKFAGSKRDLNMMSRLRAEAPAVLAWAVRGAVKWYAEGLAIPSSVSAASAAYMGENDDLSLWLDECCSTHAAATGQAATLYGHYVNWVKARGQHAPSQRVWADRLGAVPGITKRKSDGRMLYQGVGLLARED